MGKIDILTGGFPCQSFSVAGKQRGKADDRYLWPEMFRVIKAVRPRWVIGENVPGIIKLALDQVLADLEDEGYTCQTYCIPACGIDAPHKRERVWIVANAICGELRNQPGRSGGENRKDQAKPEHDGKAQPLADSESVRIQRLRPSGEQEPDSHGQTGLPLCKSETGEHAEWKAEPRICRVVDGLPNRVDRVKSLGNAIVPGIAQIIAEKICEKEGLI